MTERTIEEIPVKAGQGYRHYKGKDYFILGVGHHSETGEHLVSYIPNGYDPYKHVWSRPYDMFTGYLEDGVTKRFKLIGDIVDVRKAKRRKAGALLDS